ncbi:uncharacterized protein LOC127790453 [Diospyros lotus]|uniref:uncharacterized protein LOC127790453 n=1 Tax=Diospyros lotus TaxID=55363 RepID=UPI00225ABC84|nr:uncharacterized protein LOC127790453 [Diospyros lotus]
MAHSHVIAALVLVLVFAGVELSTCTVLKGSVSCLDCEQDHDLSNIKVAVKCSQVKKVAMATTVQDGAFETELPGDLDSQQPSASLDCLAQITGGPIQLYVSRKNRFSSAVKIDEHSFKTSAPLKFYTKCPNSAEKHGKCGAQNQGNTVCSSKILGMPLPPEWGLAPPSYYIPYIPIIGIP